jgi:hypothetical protein
MTFCIGRREFIALLGDAAAAWPLAARAHRIRTIGVLNAFARDDPQVQANLTAFRQALQKLGWTEGSISGRFRQPRQAHVRSRRRPIDNRCGH